MKTKFETSRFQGLAALGFAVITLLAGCATQQQQRRTPDPAPAPQAAPARPAAPASGYGPSYTTFDANGVKYVRGSLAFPSGLREGSGLLLEKTVPAEVLAGRPFSYEYRVINLAPCELRDVVVSDQVSSNFQTSSAEPAAASVSGGVATWRFPSLARGQTVTIKVNGAVADAGTISTCGWVTYSPVLCEPIRVVKPELQLAKTLPNEVLSCDPIPATFVVKNAGSSVLTDVKVTDALPSGLRGTDGQTTLTFNVGTLQPGESKEIKANLSATQTGRYENVANASSAQGVTAQAKATVVVKAPSLTLACEAPAERFAGRPAEFCFTISNKGDGVSANTVLEATLPAGATVQSVTGGGAASAGKVVWNVGSMAPNATSKVCVTLVLPQPGNIQLSAVARGACAKEVATSCSTRVLGIPAVLLEVIDLTDPIEVGAQETYVIEVTNQGTAPATNVRVTSRLEDSQEFVSGSGASAVTANGRVITMAPVASIPPKGKATWRVVVKALKAGDVRFQTSLLTDQITRPVEETESTNQY